MICIHLAEGFEEIEAITTADVLKRGGLEVNLVSITKEKMVTGSHNISVVADNLITEINYDKCKAIVLPGGMPGTTNLMENKYLISKIVEFDKERKLLCALCAAPMLLEKAGILKDVKATIYEGLECHIKSANYTNVEVVKDNNIITSKGPGTAMQFALEILKELKGNDKYNEVKSSLLF
ncbi:MAG TPA: DJ-1 family glyoxalase III [Anaerovoracaceae bacterium]|nr:DJ-1 family glyoxalase III [Anaerovoracaceae bacterium]